MHPLPQRAVMEKGPERQSQTKEHQTLQELLPRPAVSWNELPELWVGGRTCWASQRSRPLAGPTAPG